MKLTKENLERMYAENAEDISVRMNILRGKTSTLDTYRNGVSEIVAENPDLRDKYSLEDMKDLRNLLVRLTYAGLNKKDLRRVTRKIEKMVHAISSVEEAETPWWPWYYLYQYETFLYGLKYTITTELFLYSLSNSAIHRKLREFSEPAELAD